MLARVDVAEALDEFEAVLTVAIGNAE